MRTRLAPIRQGEGVSRTISGDSKERSVLWRVFLHTLSSRKERVCPRRAFPAVERLDNSGVVTGAACGMNARNNPPDLANARPAPFTQRGLWCGGTPPVQVKLEAAMQGKRIAIPRRAFPPGTPV